MHCTRTRLADMSVRPVLIVALTLACNGDGITAPTEFDPPGTHQSALAGLGGTGGGGVSVTPRAVAEGSFVADIKVRVRQGRPNTSYTIQRAPEIGRALGSDGSCQRALGLSPWSSADAPAAAFLSFTQPASTTPITLTTNASGDGSFDFEFRAPMIPAGTKFDVMFRLLDNTTAPTSTLVSGCFTVTVL